MANPVGIQGKSCTLTYGTFDASAQITEASVSRSKSAETVQTWGGSITVGAATQVEVSVSFVFDPAVSAFYDLLHAAWKGDTAVSISVSLGGATSAIADCVVTALEDTIPAEGLVTCSATLVTGNPDVFTGKPTP